jgi:ferredoxin--NADP+ reductase
MYDRTAKKEDFRFFGNVRIGKDISVDELKSYYHQLMFTTGAPTDKPLRIPGEDLEGSLPATEFVAWYNGHPDYADYKFDLSAENIAVVGIGNVAMDVARILARTTEELMETDIADHALEALKNSKVKNIYILGRRGPAQAAFTTPEIKELGEMQDADCFVRPDEAELDPLSAADLEENGDRDLKRKVEVIQSYAGREPSGKSKQLIVRFLVSPTELIGDENGRVKAMKIVKNELYLTDNGTMRPRATDVFEEIPVDIVFRSIGYRGVKIEGVPFYDAWGVNLNEEGRLLDEETKEPVIGMYTGGWIKRGPSGVIGTNKPDAIETVNHMLTDLAAGNILQPAHPEREAATAFVAEHKADYFSYADWLKLDALELENGVAAGRPRIKFTDVDAMKAAVGK